MMHYEVEESEQSMPNRLDAIDRAILRTLQREGRLQNTELAERVGLSPSPCLRRVRLLEEAGLIEGYFAVLDPAKAGFSLTVFVRVWLIAQDEQTVSRFVAAVRLLPEVLECHLMAGDCDFILRVVADDMDAYRRFQMEHLGRMPGVRNLKTEIPMQKIKDTRELPV
jgi:DNA-binding Lrp family transcriptional regulator